MSIYAALVLTLEAAMLTSYLHDLTSHWEQVLLHVEVIPFYLSQDEFSYEQVPIREKELIVSEDALDMQYHYVNPGVLPQWEYRQTVERLKSEESSIVLPSLAETLVWRNSALFVFLIYEPDREIEQIGSLFARENVTYNLQSLEGNITQNYLMLKSGYQQVLGLSNIHQLYLPVYSSHSIRTILHSEEGKMIQRYKSAVNTVKKALGELSLCDVYSLDDDMQVLYPSTFSQLISEFDSLTKAIHGAKRYLELRRPSKASPLITSIENSQELLRLLETKTPVMTYGAWVVPCFWVSLAGMYAVVLWQGWKFTVGSTKVQV